MLAQVILKTKPLTALVRSMAWLRSLLGATMPATEVAEILFDRRLCADASTWAVLDGWSMLCAFRTDRRHFQRVVRVGDHRSQSQYRRARCLGLSSRVPTSVPDRVITTRPHRKSSCYPMAMRSTTRAETAIVSAAQSMPPIATCAAWRPIQPIAPIKRLAVVTRAAYRRRAAMARLPLSPTRLT